ncbi:tetratricopeptide repeat protein [Thermodesulfobacteriota bacterium]
MEQEGFKRKLTAILSADVEGYSRLMGEDEDTTIRTLTAYRELMSTLIQKHRGRVVDSPGDNLLAEFGSVVDAVRCAVEVQEELRVRNAELTENRRMNFRIGVNLGDVVEEEGRIYGDGVNITARVEGLAEGGGICISGSVYDSIKSKLSLSYEPMGEHTVKNIAEPVRVYRMRIGPEATIPEKKTVSRRWLKPSLAAIGVVFVLAVGLSIWHYYFRFPPIESADVKKMAYSLPEEPSIAVLPFVNMSGDPKDDYIVDGLTESLITALSKTPKMFVIARNSVFTYKGKAVNVKQVSEDLGVRYVLEGSVQKSGDRIRINAQLIDAIKGHHLWAEKYDRDMKDIFALQDEITMKIITELRVKLTDGEKARMSAKGTSNIEVWLKHLRASQLLNSFDKDKNLQARKILKEIIELDPKYPAAYMTLGWAHAENRRWSKSPKESLVHAENFIKKALELDESSALAHLFLGVIYRYRKQWDAAIAEHERAISLNPNSIVMASLGATLMFEGSYDEAIAMFKKAFRLDPYSPGWAVTSLGVSYFMAERYEEAMEPLKEMLDRAKKGIHNPITPNRLLAATYAMLDRKEEAQYHIAELLKIDPKFTIKPVAKIAAIFKNQADADRFINAHRKAGLPEHPPLPLPDKPSIAVLPFTNMSDDPEQEYFVDGMTDDLITDLSKISGLFVIARNSAFTYKGKNVKVEQIGRELGVRHILEGSVRKAGNQVRINAQLIDAKTSGHLWAERWDGKMDDIFALQDKITAKIVAALAVKLTADETKRMADKGTNNIEAYDAYLKGSDYRFRGTNEDLVKAISFYKKAIELDPDYGKAYAGLSLIYYISPISFFRLIDESFFEVRPRAREYLKLAMKKPNAFAHRVKATMNLHLRLYDEAIYEAERAIALEPNAGVGHNMMARILSYVGRPQKAITFAERAIRLDPRNIGGSLWNIWRAHFYMGQYKEALTFIKRAIKYNPDRELHYVRLAITYAHLGLDHEARAALDEYFARSENRTSFRIMHYRMFKDQEIVDRYAQGLIKAGWPMPHKYYKINAENMLTGKEIRELLFGRKRSGIGWWTKKQWWENVTTDGKGTVQYEGRKIHTGRVWIEGDMLCRKYPKQTKGITRYYTIFRNPEGAPEKLHEYLTLSDTMVVPFSVVD